MSSPKSSTQPVRILVIDAKPINHYIISKHYHINNPTTTIIHCYTAHEAINYLTETQKLPELILLCLPPAAGGEKFTDKFNNLPDSIRNTCRLIKFKVFNDPGTDAGNSSLYSEDAADNH